MKNERQLVLWDKLIHYMEKARSLYMGMSKRQSRTRYEDYLIDYFKRLYSAKKNANPVVMTNFCFPPELVYAMEFYPMCQEIGSIMLSIANAGLNYIDVAEEGGIDKFQCNAQKVWIGASMLGEAPYPDYIIYASQPCDSTNIQYQVFKRIYNQAPEFTIDIPYWHYDPANKYYDSRTAPYVAAQLKNLVKWLEDKSGRKLNQDRFLRIIDNSNQMRELMLDTMELMRAKPSPLQSMAALNNYALLLMSGGLAAPIEYVRFIRDVAKRRVKEKRGALDARGKEEKIRVLWIYLPIFFEPLLFDWMERRFGAVVVMDMAGYAMSKLINTKTEDTIYEGLASQMLDAPMGRQSRGPAEYYIDDMLRIARDYRADCAIYGGHLGCKHSQAIATLIKEVLEKELGIPCLIFEVDCVDSRPITTPEIKRKIKLFLQTLE